MLNAHARNEDTKPINRNRVRGIGHRYQYQVPTHVRNGTHSEKVSILKYRDMNDTKFLSVVITVGLI